MMFLLARSIDFALAFNSNPAHHSISSCDIIVVCLLERENQPSQLHCSVSSKLRRVAFFLMGLIWRKYPSPTFEVEGMG